MAKEIYKSGNYIVTVDADDNSRLFPIGKTVYDEYNSVFRLTEGLIEDDQLVISYADSTNWVDDSASAYTEATLRTFLRENTGFRPASGGSGAAPVGATLNKTNRTVSVRTGDDGDIQAGRAVDFLTLASANPFGNVERFTDELGGQTYTNNIVIDWSTYNGTDVLGYINQTQSSTNWNTAIDNCLAYSVGSYTSGWRLPNVLEIFNLYDFGNINGLGSYRLYRPPVFNLGVNRYWTSTIARFSNTVHTADSQYGEIRYTGITSSAAYFPCRTFTVSGTTLT